MHGQMRGLETSIATTTQLRESIIRKCRNSTFMHSLPLLNHFSTTAKQKNRLHLNNSKHNCLRMKKILIVLKVNNPFGGQCKAFDYAKGYYCEIFETNLQRGKREHTKGYTNEAPEGRPIKLKNHVQYFEASRNPCSKMSFFTSVPKTEKGAPSSSQKRSFLYTGLKRN